MPVVLAILAAAGGLIFWMMRARNAAQAAQELVDMAGDLASAARRFGFRRQAGRHPVEALDQPDVAVAGLAMAMMEVGGAAHAGTADCAVDQFAAPSRL